MKRGSGVHQFNSGTQIRNLARHAGKRRDGDYEVIGVAQTIASSRH
ncbi:hypothetical protein HNP81_001048 [Peribacillus huizhouensis]|uniref:Uncharacterized protein n=1 Tax=Peribacillus huizhouensis TaxID=1501239 RepID=A0ABR6CL48_9BACI|nr:hypothetical protein [Peribacillus huizhouensis]